jgi:ankyrin repeat protein
VPTARRTDIWPYPYPNRHSTHGVRVITVPETRLAALAKGAPSGRELSHVVHLLHFFFTAGLLAAMEDGTGPGLEQERLLWRAACEGLPLPPEVHVHSYNTAYALLRVAIWNDHRRTVAELLQKIGEYLVPHVDLVNVVVGQGMRPLAYAALHGSVHAAAALLDANAAVNGGVFADEKPLYISASHGHEAMVSLLTDANANVDEVVGGRTLIGDAARDGDHTAVVGLLAAKAQPDRADEQGRVPLHVACMQGDVVITQVLLCAKADVDRHCAWTSWSPLIVASCQGHVTVMRALIDGNADVNRADDCRRTALSHAAERGSAAVIALLVVAKADVNDTRSCRPPLVEAAKHGHYHAVSQLLQAKADVHSADQDRWTAYYYACKDWWNTGLVAVLVEAKAGLQTRN